VVAGDFDRDGKPDLAILMEDRGEVWIYTNHGDGTFTHTFSIPVGDGATGLSTTPGGGPGLIDLLVGNQFGDVLRLIGNGDGTFFQNAGSHTSLAVQQDLFGPGRPGVLVGNQAANSVTVQQPDGALGPAAQAAVLRDGTPLPALAPADVQWARLDSGNPFAVVVESGSNQVLVARFLGVQGGASVFDTPQTYFVGDDPVSVTVTSLEDDLAPELLPGVAGPAPLIDPTPDLVVANQGSNDVSLLIGHLDASGHWYATPGPRLKSDGFGPLGAMVRDNPSGPPDLLVANGAGGTLSLLPGVGQGFFNDQAPQSVPVPGNAPPGQPVPVGPDGEAVLAAGGQLLAFNLNNLAEAVRTVFAPPPGQGVAAVQPLPNGDLVVAEQGGTVQMLALQPDSGLFEPVATYEPLTGIPSEPSALAVLDSGDVLVTNQGQDQLFVFGLAASGPGPAPGLPFAPARAVVLPALVLPANPVAESSAPSEAPLALVLTLAADVLPVGEPPSGGAHGVLPAGQAAPGQAGDASAIVPDVNAGNPAEAVAPVDPAGDAEAVAPPSQEDSPEGGVGLPGIDELLRWLEQASRPTDAWGGPITQSPSPNAPGLPGDRLAPFWLAAGQGTVLTGLGCGPFPPACKVPLPPPPAHAALGEDGGFCAPADPGVGVCLDRSEPASPVPGGTAESQSPVRVPVPASAWDWRRPVLAALAAGGLALWIERRFLAGGGRGVKVREEDHA
jgi:hypothetical protein